MALDGEGNVWIGTYKHGIYIYNKLATSRTSQQATVYLTQKYTAILKTLKETCGLERGVALIYGQVKREAFVQFESDSHPKAGLFDSIVEDIHQTNAGQNMGGHTKGT